MLLNKSNLVDIIKLDVDFSHKRKFGDLSIFNRNSIHTLVSYKLNEAIKIINLAIFFSYKKQK